ncbi:hypothetical protein [Anaerocolumna cellulosilytica]
MYNNEAPIVDSQFSKHMPEYSKYDGDLLIHHHIGRGGQVAAYPETLHPGFGGIHNYEKEANVTGNDYLTSIAQTLEPGKEKKKKRNKCEMGG